MGHIQRNSYSGQNETLINGETMPLLEGLVESHLKLSHWKYWRSFVLKDEDDHVRFFSCNLLLAKILFVLTFFFNFKTHPFYVTQNLT